MLENTPFNPAQLQERDPSQFGGRALRVVGWSDLTARINAARDLRELLRQDLVLGAASFTDAAAGYFVPDEEGKRAVNHNALEPCKGLEDKKIDIENAEAADHADRFTEQGCRENK